MPIFYEVARLTTDPIFSHAAVRIDTEKRVENGCEAVIIGKFYSEADAKAHAVKAAEQNPPNSDAEAA